MTREERSFSRVLLETSSKKLLCLLWISFPSKFLINELEPRFSISISVFIFILFSVRICVCVRTWSSPLSSCLLCKECSCEEKWGGKSKDPWGRSNVMFIWLFLEIWPQGPSDLPPHFSSHEHSLHRRHEDKGLDQVRTQTQILTENKMKMKTEIEIEKRGSNLLIRNFEGNEIQRRHSSFFEGNSNKTLLKERSSLVVSDKLGIYMEDSTDSLCAVSVF